MNILKRIGGAITGDRKYTANDIDVWPNLSAAVRGDG